MVQFGKLHVAQSKTSLRMAMRLSLIHLSQGENVVETVEAYFMKAAPQHNLCGLLSILVHLQAE